ncbi:MAG: L,D-transpeptidase family protein [Gemmatimonadaceae bacterium]|nr:L,D-transpeptidase family protein [Gemmatimonadaceae bacterium]
MARLPRFTARAALLALAVTAALDGCSTKGKRARYTPGAAAKVLNVDMGAIPPAIAARVDSGTRPNWVSKEGWSRVGSLYKSYNNNPLWLEERGAKDRAAALIDAIKHAPDHGLETSAYPLAQLEAVVDAKRLTDTASARTLADADVMLTSAYVAYASDMLIGQIDPKKVSQSWFTGSGVKERDSSIVAALQDSDMTAALAAMAPQDSDYAVLKRALARYRQIAAAGGWTPVTQGMSDSLLLRAVHARHLPEMSDSSHSGETDIHTGLDSATEAAHAKRAARSPLAAELVRFQTHHGLSATGKLDKETLAALNITAEQRVQQIAANMERHRWLPRTLGSRYIYVNVPSFRLDAYDSGQKVLSMRVVVGSEYQGRTTPTFSDSMEVAVFRPYWNITPDIQRLEIEPKVASNPGYLEAENMEYYKDGGATRIRQRPGGKNALGLVKFLFPNDFNIYLHDTPAKTLFAQDNRAASHGCIRVEKPAELAQWVLGWDAARVDAAMNSGADNHTVKLPHKIPVYIVYFTAYVRDGELVFADDLYGRDDALERQLATPTTVTAAT